MGIFWRPAYASELLRPLVSPPLMGAVGLKRLMHHTRPRSKYDGVCIGRIGAQVT